MKQPLGPIRRPRPEHPLPELGPDAHENLGGLPLFKLHQIELGIQNSRCLNTVETISWKSGGAVPI
jgi:hypothetical protein